MLVFENYILFYFYLFSERFESFSSGDIAHPLLEQFALGPVTRFPQVPSFAKVPLVSLKPQAKSLLEKFPAPVRHRSLAQSSHVANVERVKMRLLNLFLILTQPVRVFDISASCSL